MDIVAFIIKHDKGYGCPHDLIDEQYGEEGNILLEDLIKRDIIFSLVLGYYKVLLNA